MKKIAFLVVCAAILGGCAIMVPGHLYPVQGPLSMQSTPPSYEVTLNGIMNSGSIEIHPANGISCGGEWSMVAQGDPSARQLAIEWDTVYGSGFFVANVLGRSSFGRSALTCQGGEKISLEFLMSEPGNWSTAKGVARDAVGNVYKLTF